MDLGKKKEWLLGLSRDMMIIIPCPIPPTFFTQLNDDLTSDLPQFIYDTFHDLLRRDRGAAVKVSQAGVGFEQQLSQHGHEITSDFPPISLRLLVL